MAAKILRGACSLANTHPVAYNSLWTDTVLPLLIFPALAALAFNFIHVHLFESGLADKLAAQCPSSAASLLEEDLSYRLAYTGLQGLDKALCGFVAFFHTLMTPGAPLTFLTYFLGTAAPIIVIPAVESCRNNRSFSTAYPIIIGILCQTVTVGVTMPIYWLLFIASGAAKPKHTDSGSFIVPQAHAEAIAFGTIVGVVVPSAGLLFLADPHVTAIWQMFPVYLSIAQLAHRAIRPVSRHPYSGYNTIQVLYIGIFIISSSIHLSILWPRRGDVEALRTLFLPSIAVLDPATAIELQTFDFLKWDFVFTFLSTTLATLWFASTLKQLLALIVWNVIAAPIVGPGATIIGSALWREYYLQQMSTKAALKPKEE